MPSGKLGTTWRPMEEATTPGGAQPQAFGNGAFKELYHSAPEIASNLNANTFHWSAFLPMTLVIGLLGPKHYLGGLKAFALHSREPCKLFRDGILWWSFQKL